MVSDVSVIVPTYNRAHIISKTLECVFGQTLPPAEVIVVDDGSTDDTEAKVMGRFPKTRYVKIPNSGSAGARHEGVLRATGEWLAFIDDDDLWTSEYLNVHAAFRRTAPDVPFIFSNFKRVVDGHWSDRTKFDDAPPGFFDFRQRVTGNGFRVCEEPLVDRLLRYQLLFPSAEIMRRSFYDQTGGWNGALGHTLSYDMEFALRCCARSPIGIIDDPLVGIRKHASNKSGDSLLTGVGEIEVLFYVAAHHELSTESRRILEDEVVLRSLGVAHGAFHRCEDRIFWRALANVPLSRRDPKLHLKSLINTLPTGLRRMLCRRVLGLSCGSPSAG